MRKVETQTVCRYKRTSLFHVASQYQTQCLLEQVGCTVILAGLDTVLRIYLQGNGIAHLEHALRHPAYMTDLSSLEMDDILYGKFTMRSDDRAGISLLAAHGCVERRHIRNDGALQAIGQRFHNLVGSGKGCCPSAVLQTLS